MKRLISIVLSVFGVLILANPGHASDFKIKLQPGAQELRYNNIAQYLNMKLSTLIVPQQESPPWYKKVFVKRKDYGIAYFDYTFEDGSKIKQPLFQYEKAGNDDYKYNYLVTSKDAPAYLLEKVLISRPFKMQLVVKNWESGENTALLKKFVNKLNLFSAASPDVLSASFKTALEVGSTALESIEEIFPPNNTEESGVITIDPDNLRESYTITMLDDKGEENSFLSLEMTHSESLFTESGGLFDEALIRYSDKFKGVPDWKDIVQSADQDTKSGDIGPIINTLATFNKHITSLKITNTDKILLLAKAACRWAPTTMQQEHISAEKFSEISVEGATSVLDEYEDSALNGCKFKKADCQQAITCAAFYFYSRSSNSKLKNKSKKYIDGAFDLTSTDGVTISVSVEEYLEHFKLRGRSKWQKTGEKDNSTYVFDKPVVTVSHTKADELYSGVVKSINFYEDNGQFFLGEIVFEKSQGDT